MYLVSPSSAIATIWTAIFIVWIVGAMSAKPAARRQSGAPRIAQLAMNVTAGWLLFGRNVNLGVLSERFIARSDATAWAGVVGALAGAAFTIWARLTIGRNWSGVISVKREHELVMRGPYALVRHPIYAGLLLTITGTALVVGEWRGLVAVALTLVAWRWKSLIEERVMTEQFGSAYEVYKSRVKALIPFVL